MKLFTNLKFVALFAFLVAVPFTAGAFTERVSAEGNTNAAQTEKNEDKPAEKPAKEAFSYTAQAGDSYSLIARKAIQTFGINNKVDLSRAQIIYAETMLTQEAGSPELDKGQAVNIKEASVKNWVEKAQKLSKEDQAAWDVYAQNADFNTNNVGESRS